MLATDRSHVLREIMTLPDGGHPVGPRRLRRPARQDPVRDGMNKGLTIRTGQTHVRCTEPFCADRGGHIDPWFVVTHPVRLEDGPEMYRKFRDKQDGVIKVVLRP